MNTLGPCYNSDKENAMTMYALPLNTLFTEIDDRLLDMIKKPNTPSQLSVSLQYLVEKCPVHLTYIREKIQYKVDHFLLQQYSEELGLIAKRISNLPFMVEKGMSVVCVTTVKKGQVFIIGTEEYIAQQTLLL